MRIRRSGFTLLEIMLVIAIMGMLVTIALARMEGLVPAYRLRMALREIGQAVAWTRSEAIAQGTPLGVRYDLAKGEYWIVFPDETGEISDKVEEERLRFHRKRLPEGVRFLDFERSGEDSIQTGYATVRFSFLGACDWHLIHLKSDEGNSFSIEVLPLSGEVNIFEGYKEIETAKVP